MKTGDGNFCPHCGGPLIKKPEGHLLRKYCGKCAMFFYDNPLPVVSCIVSREREILLVRRARAPYKGLWCLPSGFAETGESIEDAALRELQEETGIRGHIMSLVDVDSCRNYYYGDLIFVTFEAASASGEARPGDDAAGVRYFPIGRIPRLAFSSNRKAVDSYIKSKADYWAMVDSFGLTMAGESPEQRKKQYLSDRLIEVIEKNAPAIVDLWVREVLTRRSTAVYRTIPVDEVYHRGTRMMNQFARWLRGFYTELDNREFYLSMGSERKREGFKPSEVFSAMSLLRKSIWEFALSQGLWSKPIDMYIVLELDRRMVLFFDRAGYHLARGFEVA